MRPTTSSLLAAGLAAAAVAASGLLSAPAAVAADPTPAQLGAGWLTGQFIGGDHLETTFDGTAYPDAGLTADAVLALDAAGVGQATAVKATAWLAAAGNLGGYIGDGDAESYAGAHAKLAVVAEAQGQDPTSFGGRDLVGELQALEAEDGRFSDTSQYGDYSNGITQSLAILALHRADAGPDAAAVSFLTGSACENGGFPLDFGQEACAADPDVTAYAVQALLAVGQDEAAGAGLDYLESVQHADGGFGGAGPTAAENANSTGLAVQALTAGGRDEAAAAGSAYLLTLQVGCTGTPAGRGAFAYSSAGFDAGTAPRATTQAVPALAGVSLAEVTNEGATDAVPTLPCAPATTTAPPTTTAAPTGTPADTASPAPGAGGEGSLPATGGPTGLLAVTGLLLVAAGSGLVVLTRQRRRAVSR